MLHNVYAVDEARLACAIRRIDGHGADAAVGLQVVDADGFKDFLLGLFQIG